MRPVNILYVVVPCYNEEAVLRDTARCLCDKLRSLTADGKISDKSKIVFVDDGSRDKTLSIIESLCGEDDAFAAVALSRNRGHQTALLAGLMAVKDEADMVISIDADLQDDVSVIDEMVDAFAEGSDIVYGVRSGRNTDSFFKRFTAEAYYKSLRKLGCDIVFNHADFRLMSARALDALSQYCEQSPFLRGLVPMLGYKTSIVSYERSARLAGESKYPLKRMLSLALDGVTSLSLRPIRFITGTGVFALAFALALSIYAAATLFAAGSMRDWTIVSISVWAVGGLILVALGIVGEYAGRAYMETKRRPRYNIEKTIGLHMQTGGEAAFGRKNID